MKKKLHCYTTVITLYAFKILQKILKKFGNSHWAFSMNQALENTVSFLLTSCAQSDV